MKTTLVETKEFDYESVYTSIDPERTYTVKGKDLIRMINWEKKNVVDVLPASVFWKDLQSRVLGCNHYMANLFNYATAEEVIGKNNYDLTEKSKADIVQKMDEEVLKTGVPLQFEEEIEVVKGDGVKKYTFLSIKAPMRSQNNQIIGIIGCSIDITEIHKARKRSENAQIMSGGIAHDIKNQVMIGDLVAEKEMFQIDMALENGEISERFAIKLKENKAILTESHQKIYSIIEKSTNAIQYQIIEQQDIQNLEFKSGAITNVITEVLGQFAKQDKIHFFENYTENFNYLGDPLLIEKIITNLANNSLREIEKKGKGIIYFSSQEEDQYNVLKIKDTAGGITQELVDTIFDLYKRGKVQGTGLGLSSAKIYMEQMNGKIEAYLVDEDCIMFALFFPKITHDYY